MTTLYKSLVRSLLEYCCPLWDPVKVTEIQLLDGVQRTFTNRIGGLNKYELLGEAFASKAVMSLQRRRERYTILMIWKILHNVVPNCSNIKSTNRSIKAEATFESFKVSMSKFLL